MRFLSVLLIAILLTTSPDSFCRKIKKEKLKFRTSRLENGGPLLLVRSIEIGYLKNSSTQNVLDIGQYRKGSWGKIEVGFSSSSEYLDEIQVGYKILLGDKETVLTGTQTCLHIQKGPKHYTSLFIYPGVLEKYGGEIAGVSIYIRYKGTLSTAALLVSPGGPRNWWDEGEVMKRKNVKWLRESRMINWYFTPFDLEGIEKYELTKTKLGHRFKSRRRFVPTYE